MANHFTSAGVLDVTSAVKLLDKTIDVMFMRRNEVAPDNLAEFFDVENKAAGTGLTHKVSTYGSVAPLPKVNSDTEPLPRYTPAPGYDKSFTLLNYRQGIQVTATLLKTERFAKVSQIVAGLIKSGFQWDAYMRASVVNGAFASTTGADGSYLCADAHAEVDGSSPTWDNLGTGALSGPNLQALVLLMMNMTNEKGYPMVINPKALRVPPALLQKALELTTATGKPEGMFNDPNVIIKGLNVDACRYFSSATAYFLFGDLQGFEKGLCEVTLEDWGVADNKPENVDIVMDKRVKAIKTFGATISKNVYGSVGT